MDQALELAYQDESTVERQMSLVVESTWRSVGEEDAFGGDFELEKDMVWLECDFEFVDRSSVKTLGARHAPLNGEMVRFVCPHCGQRHESLRFR